MFENLEVNTMNLEELGSIIYQEGGFILPFSAERSTRWRKHILMYDCQPQNEPGLPVECY